MKPRFLVPILVALAIPAALAANADAGTRDEPSPLVVGNVDFVRPTPKSSVIDATVESLRRQFPGRKVEQLEIPVKDFGRALEEGRIDIYVTSAGHAFRLQQSHRARVLGSLVSHDYPDPNHADGAAILVRKDSGFKKISDLRGKTLAANTPVAFTGYHIPMGEVAKVSPDWESFFSATEFTGGGPRLGKALEDVAEGRTDAAFARLCYFEDWARSHPKAALNLRVLEPKTGKGEACARSTELYPGWTITATDRLTPEEARLAAIAVMSVKPDRYGNFWGVATDFLHVDELYKRLRIGKYAYLRDWTLERFAREYGGFLAVAALLFLGLILHSWRAGVLVRRRTAQLNAVMKRERELEAESRSASEHLERLQKMGALGQVSGMLAHEMRQPLATISFYLDGIRLLMRKGVAGPEEKLGPALSEIERQTRKADAIVEHARRYARFSRSDQGREWVRLDETLAHTVENWRVSRRKAPAIEKDFSRAAAWVHVDPLEFECVVFNILKNAGEAAAKSESPKVSVLAEASGGKARIVIRDNGPALSDEEFRKLLSRDEGSAKPDGLGLGLSIVRGLLEAYGSRLVFERLPGAGLEARFELECRPQPPLAAEGPKKDSMEEKANGVS